MANTKQAIKMVRKTERRTQYNRWWKTRVKNALKELSKKDIDTPKAVSALQKVVDKAIQKGVLHKRTGSRIKSTAIKTLQTSKN